MWDYYTDKTIFITGSTGFVGAATLCRIVDKCSPKHIYVLCRGGEKSAREKWQSLLQPSTANKLIHCTTITVLSGDLMSDKLGIPDDDWSNLEETVDIVIHSASTISLHSRLQKMIRAVIEPTLALAEFALKCKHLKRFVFVSTAYSNAHLWTSTDAQDVAVEECIHPISDDQDIASSTLAALDEIRTTGTSQEFESHNFPYAYAYAKHLTERLVSHKFASHGVNEKLLIVRPSIICPATDFPYPGYCLPASAPSTLWAASMILNPGHRVVIGSRCRDPLRNSNLDEVPVDVVVDRLLMHLVLGTSGPVHAVRGPKERFRLEDYMRAVHKERRYPWPLKPVLLPLDWHDRKIHPAIRLFKVPGTSFAFSEDKTIEASKRLSDEEYDDLRLFVNPGEHFTLDGRMDDVRQVSLALARRNKFPLWLVKFLCGKRGSEKRSVHGNARM